MIDDAKTIFCIARVVTYALNLKNFNQEQGDLENMQIIEKLTTHKRANPICLVPEKTEKLGFAITLKSQRTVN